MRRPGILSACVALFFSAPAACAQEPFDELWDDLGDGDAVAAYRAIWTLTKTPAKSLVWIAENLPPATAPDPKLVAELIQDLNSDTFALREKATKELTKLGDHAEAAVRKALLANPTPETKQRLERIVARLEEPITAPEQLQSIRAVETLEIMGEDAKTLLKRYADGAPGALLTKEAARALERMATAPKTSPLKDARVDLYGDPLPEGVVARLGTVRFRREYLGTTVREGMVFLPGDRAIVTYPITITGLPLNRDHGIQIWEAATGRLLRTINAEPLGISACAVSADGRTLAVAASPRPVSIQRPSEVRVFHLPSGELARSFTYKTGGVTHNLALSPDGKILLSLRSGKQGRPDSFLQVEEIATGKVIAKKAYPSSAYAKMVLSGDGKYLAVSNNKVSTKDIMLWNWRDPEKRPLTLDNTKIVDSSSLASVSSTYGGFEFSPDGKWFAMIDAQGQLYLWEISSGRLHLQQKSVLIGTYSGPAFTADSKTLAWLTRDQAASYQVVLLDVASSQRKQVIENVATLYSHLAFARDGKTLAINATQTSLALQLWDIAGNKSKAADAGPRAPPQQLIVSSKGVLASADIREIRIWDSATTRTLSKLPFTGTLYAFALAPDARLAAWISTDAVIHITDTQTGQEKFRLGGPGARGGKKAVAFAADNMSLHTFGGDFQLRDWDMKTGSLILDLAIRPLGVDLPADEQKLASFILNQGMNPVFSPNGRTLLVGLGEKYFLFDTATGKEISQFSQDARSSVSKFAMSPDGNYLLSRSNGTSVAGQPSHSPVSLTELATGKSTRRWQVPGLAAGPIAYSPDGRMFATTGDDAQKTIALYEISSGKLRGTIEGLSAKVSSLTFLPDGRHLATGMGDSTILIWDLATAVN